MKLAFTKMQGAGNDFVVLNEIATPLPLTASQYKAIADRRFGVGADQFLLVGTPKNSANDFSYRIINADGSEVEHCGNGARCFLRYVRDKGLTKKTRIKVEVSFGVLELTEEADHSVTVQIAVPRFAPEQIPFAPSAARTRTEGVDTVYALEANGAECWVSVVNMGNPHAVQVVADVDAAPVTTEGPFIERHAAFPARVNVGYMQVIDQHSINLRVWERGVGETLACGTGASAAVIAGIRRGLLTSPVTVNARGGVLRVSWRGDGQMAYLSGPAVTVFEGEIHI